MKRLSWSMLLYYWTFIEKVQAGDVTMQFKDDTANISKTRKETIIAFDGSSTLKEWVGNVRAYFTVKGFHKNFFKTAAGFMNELHLSKTKNIMVIGTSRGGAIAIIVAYLLKIAGYKVRCITFVQPKVAVRKNAFRKLVESLLEVHRVIAGRDIVDNMPPIGYHYETFEYKLDTVKGKLDHTAIRKALENKIKGL